MAGHSKWANIQHRKGRQDAARSKLFSKLAKEITIAAKIGEPDPDKNPRLRLAVKEARSNSMPKDVIDRAIKKSQMGDAENYEEIRYEGYGPAGVALIVEALTDNRNRTASEVRAAFSKHGGNLAESGSVSFMFERIGLIRYKADAASADDIFEAVLEAGAENVDSAEGGHQITCRPDDLSAVRDALEKRFGPAVSAALDWRPRNTVPVDEGSAETLFQLLDLLDDNDDVQRVAANFEVADNVMDRLGA